MCPKALWSRHVRSRARPREIQKTHEELTARMADPEIFSDPKAYADMNKRLAEISPAVEILRA